MPFFGNFVLLRRFFMSLYEFYKHKNNLFFSYHPDSIDKSIELHNSPNWHESIELLYCTEGYGEAVINSEHVPMKKGTITIINSNRIHYIAPHSDIIRFGVLIIDPEFLKTFGIDVKKLDFEASITDATAINFYEAIVNNCEENRFFRNQISNGLTLSLMAHIADCYSKEKTVSSDENKVIRAIDYIKNNFKDNISVDDVAENAGFSRYYLSRKFKELTGFSINEYIRMFRCHEAHAMLETHKYTVTEVAAECGFSDASYFAKVYKTFFPTSPSEAKRKQRQTAEI